MHDNLTHSFPVFMLFCLEGDIEIIGSCLLILTVVLCSEMVGSGVAHRIGEEAGLQVMDGSVQVGGGFSSESLEQGVGLIYCTLSARPYALHVRLILLLYLLHLYIHSTTQC